MIQFIPNDLPENAEDLSNDLLQVENIPENIRFLLKETCYDCHSNQVRYPWYSYVAPVSWLVARDVRDGRDELNLSEWGDLKKRKKIKALSDLTEEVEEKNMPLPIYPIMHKNARLSDEQRNILIEWAKSFNNRLFEEEE